MIKAIFDDVWQVARRWVEPNIRQFLAARVPVLWALAALIGVLVAISAILFRALIAATQFFWIGTFAEQVASTASRLPAWQIMAGPVIGGLLVGLALHYIQPGRKTAGVADVIEARLRGGATLGLWRGISSSIITAVSLGAGASAGREGPVVHLGATLASFVARRCQLTAPDGKILLAAGAASAISASFNAPIAGVLFAHEVVLGHYAVSAFVPLVISATGGAVLSRLWFGADAAFIIPDYQIVSYWEVPSFALLGLTCAAVAILFQFALICTDWMARNVSIPLWLRPVIGGTVIGAIGTQFPAVLGVGYQMTDAALQGALPLFLMLCLIVLKAMTTAITLASRFGGGIFSPALYLGAMTGGAFGLISASVFPELASSHGLYAIVGMGSVAAAILNAPISTAVIVFELTGGYELSLALLISVSIAVGLCQAVHGRSFFHWQLEMRGLFIRKGAHQYLCQKLQISDVMQRYAEPLPDEERSSGRPPAPAAEPAPRLGESDSLERALKLFDASGLARIYVIDAAEPAKIIGEASHVAVLRRYNAALIEEESEAHG